MKHRRNYSSVWFVCSIWLLVLGWYVEESLQVIRSPSHSYFQKWDKLLTMITNNVVWKTMMAKYFSHNDIDVMDKSHDMHVSMVHAQHSTWHICDGHALHHIHASIDHAHDTWHHMHNMTHVHDTWHRMHNMIHAHDPWHHMHTTCLHASLYK
jgi:hypothetical protein